MFVPHPWLNPKENGAVLVYERAGNRFAISTSEPVRAMIPDYLLASIEQPITPDREDATTAEVVGFAASDFAAMFRKYFGDDASRNHPSIKADRYLMAVATILIVMMVAVVATLHWRGEKARALP